MQASGGRLGRGRRFIWEPPCRPGNGVDGGDGFKEGGTYAGAAAAAAVGMLGGAPMRAGPVAWLLSWWYLQCCPREQLPFAKLKHMPSWPIVFISCCPVCIVRAPWP